MQNSNVTVQTSLMPFKRTFDTVGLNHCKTLQDVVNCMIPYNFADCKLVVTHNGNVVYADYESVILKENDLIGLNFVPMGGGGSGKNTIMMIGLVVAAIALPWAAGLAYTAAAGLSAATIGGVSITGALAYGGVLVTGSLLLSMAQSALMSTPKQSSGSGVSESQTSFIEGARNTINKYGVIPINLGTNRIFPNQAALPFTESSANGKDQYVRQLFTYGYGKLLITDRKLGETELDKFKGVEIEDRLNADLNQGTSLYTNDIYQQDLNVALTKADGYVVRTTQTDVDEAEIDITFQGLCRYNDDGSKSNAAVQFEIQYAPTGTQNWSVPSGGFQITNSQSLTLDLTETIIKRKVLTTSYYYTTNTFIVLDTCNGSVYTTQVTCNQNNVNWPSLPEGNVVLGYIRGQRHVSGNYTALQYIDNHDALIGNYINSASDFAITCDFSSYSAVVVNISDGYIKGITGTMTVSAATSVALRKSKRFIFPTKGQYDIRVRRLTDDSTDDKMLDKSYLTSLKSISYTNPVSFANISGTGMRIKANDQLSGAVDTYNVIASTLLKSYNPNTQLWEDDKISSNPADIFRYVLQSPAFAKHLPDNKIDIEKLEEWWVYCDSLSLTYNRVIDYDTSVDDVLNDICAAGVATLSKVNNIYSVIIDNERPIIKGMVTPRNSWDYKGNINYPDLPHALRIEFRNQEKGYETDERIVYADGYNENNATLYERLEFSSCTDASLAYWYGRRYFATAILQPETHTFKMDFESMTFNRGDRITFVNDVILVGVGQGRIKELIVNDVDNPTALLGFTIDDKLNIPQTINLGVRIRDNDVTEGYKYHLLQNVEGITDTFMFFNAVDYNEAPAIGSLCAFVEDGKELDLIITQIKPNKDQSATITAIDYAPDRFTPLSVIPEFVSNITIPPDFYQPYAPVLASEIQTDESVMIKNTDGSFTSVAVISLVNRNEDNVNPIVLVKPRNTTEWYKPTTLKRDANEIVITGLKDGEYYDFDIRYQRQTGLQLVSESLMLENVKYVGGSTPPANVKRFRVSVTNGLALFTWLPNEDLDISHYVIRYSGLSNNVTWDNAQIAMDNIKGTSITSVIHKGTYLIKAVDVYGNESIEPSIIVSNNSGAYENVVETFIEEPDWLGSKTNVVKVGNMLELASGATEGYYYFENQSFDLGEIYNCSLTANIFSALEKRNRIRDITTGIRNITTGLRDIGAGWSNSADWLVELQMNLSDDGVNWSGWELFTASQLNFRYIKFRLHIKCEDVENLTVRISICRVTIDMPDRYESGEDIEITNASSGATIVYNIPFKNNPSVNITVQDGAIDDKIEFVTKNNQGFTIKVFNGTLNSYVTRSFDFLAAGYGRIT
jgi:hypothetical protein